MTKVKYNAPKRHYKPVKIDVKYIVKREPRSKDAPRFSTPPLIVFFPGERAPAGMIRYLAAVYAQQTHDPYTLPGALKMGEVDYEYYLDCKPVALTPEQIGVIEGRLALSWAESDRKDLQFRRVTKVSEEDRQMMWG